MTEEMNATQSPAPVILCADDFGVSPGVDRAIVALAGEGRLSAVSCMSLGPAFKTDAPALKATGVPAGIHLTLTRLPLLTGGQRRFLAPLILASWARLLSPGKVERELRAQFEKFLEVWGSPPAFIDGHEHVHVLPVVRDVVLKLRDVYAPRAWVRNVSDPGIAREGLTGAVLAVLGWRFGRLLRARGIPCNPRLRAIRRLAVAGHLGPGTLVYCHPGFPDETLAQVDGFLEPRRREYEALRQVRLPMKAAP